MCFLKEKKKKCNLFSAKIAKKTKAQKTDDKKGARMKRKKSRQWDWRKKEDERFRKRKTG